MASEKAVLLVPTRSNRRILVAVFGHPVHRGEAAERFGRKGEDEGCHLGQAQRRRFRDKESLQMRPGLISFLRRSKLVPVLVFAHNHFDVKHSCHHADTSTIAFWFSTLCAGTFGTWMASEKAVLLVPTRSNRRMFIGNRLGIPSAARGCGTVLAV